MCLIAFAWNPGSPEPLLVIANRDEHYARPTAALGWWDDGQILAGRDLQAGGSWMGLSRSGRFAALTNYRDPSRHQPDARSRGALVVDFLRGDGSASDYIRRLRGEAAAYNDFNLLLFDGAKLLGYESRADRCLRFGRGAHAVSNACFDTPWPKVERLKAGLAAAGALDDDLQALLRDRSLAPDAQLPHTGVPLEWERALSAIFIRTPTYGTRSSAIVRLGRNQARFREWTFDHGEPAGQSEFNFPLS
ncbi:NRDE family protein [Chitinimonas sp.]|uniref:NRDE family protein n=1 Tax=Chitinimonas sp. TaxID=1934313 RepID=UPI0035ADD91E